jgi:hypothetical protein
VNHPSPSDLPPDSPPFLTIQRACELLVESTRTFYRRVQLGIYPPLIKNGRKSLVSTAWLLQEVQRRLRGITS